MKRMYRVNERIYNPFGDELISSTEYLIKKYGITYNTYISFTEQDKLGINPRSKYDTPIGIYTYPLHKVLKRVGKDVEAHALKIGHYVPFAGHQPWVWVVQPNTSKGKFISEIGNESSYGKRDLEDDLEILKRLYENEDTHSKIGMSHRIASGIEGTAWDLAIDYWTKGSRDKSSGGKMWNITRELAKRLSDRKSHVLWNKILRDDLGYIGIADLGEGIIHPSEPNQCVFFSRGGLNVIDKIENVAQKGDITDQKKNFTKVARNQVMKNKPKYLKMIETIDYNKLSTTNKDYIGNYFEYYISEENPDDLDFIDMDKINDPLNEYIDEVVMENMDSFGGAWSYGHDNPEYFIEEDPEDTDEEGDPEWSEDQREQAAQEAEVQAQGEYYRELKNEILGSSLQTIKNNYPEAYTLFTDIDNVDILWLMRHWTVTLFLDDDWNEFIDYSTAYFEDDDHVEFINEVLLEL